MQMFQLDLLIIKGLELPYKSRFSSSKMSLRYNTSGINQTRSE